jgi:hypothetical protein
MTLTLVAEIPPTQSAALPFHLYHFVQGLQCHPAADDTALCLKHGIHLHQVIVTYTSLGDESKKEQAVCSL